MPIVMKASDNGFVDVNKKTICLPNYLMPQDRMQAMRRAALATAAAATLGMGALPATADIVSITDSNATATINTGSSTGMNSLIINSTQQLNQQWFYFKTTSIGAASPINSLSQTFLNKPVSEGGTDPENKMEVQYTGTYVNPGNATLTAPFIIDVQYNSLTGFTNGASVTELVTIVNNSATSQSLPMNFFEYNDFDLNNTPNNDSVVITTNTAIQTDTGTGITTSNKVDTPAPSHVEAALTTSATPILTAFAGAGFTTLNDNTSSGTGNATYAFEWDTNIAAGGAFQISAPLTISNVPEPTTAVMMLGGGSLWAMRRSRRRAVA